jgi:hypothetical protein
MAASILIAAATRAHIGREHGRREYQSAHLPPPFDLP